MTDKGKVTVDKNVLEAYKACVQELLSVHLQFGDVENAVKHSAGLKAVYTANGTLDLLKKVIDKEKEKVFNIAELSEQFKIYNPNSVLFVLNQREIRGRIEDAWADSFDELPKDADLNETISKQFDDDYHPDTFIMSLEEMFDIEFPTNLELGNLTFLELEQVLDNVKYNPVSKKSSAKKRKKA